MKYGVVRRRYAAMAVVLGFSGGFAGPAVAAIPWRSGITPTAPKAPTELRDALQALAVDQAAPRHVVVQFNRPTAPAERDALRRAGLHVLDYLGDHAFFAAIAPDELRPVEVAQAPGLIDVRPIERNWKLHPSFVDGSIPAWAVVRDAGPAGTIIAAYVVFHRDVPLDTVGVATLAHHDAVVVSPIRSVNALVIELPLARVAALADEDVVQWLEPPLPLLSEVNDSNRALTQADLVQAPPYNLDGTGVGVLVYDAGFALASHADFGGRLTVRDTSGLSNHATHVSGTVGGSGAASGGTWRGMAPGVTIESYGFEWNGAGIFLYSNPGDIEADYNEAINVFGADISNNSIGTNTCSNGFDCNITGDYGVTSGLIDAIVGGSLGAPFRIVWANGNERGCSNCTNQGGADANGYHSTAPPACAKNQIAVGALNSNNDSMTSFSSWGPCDDGRLRPDVSAPGCQSNGDGGVTSTSSSGGYTTFCGTSMASPTVCGLSALLLEDYRAQFPGLSDPRNATLKALLAHNATDNGNTGPDFQFGYGSVRIKNTIDFMRSGSFLEDQVGQGGNVPLQVDVPGGATVLRITLAWDDVPGTPNVSPALVNDLDLVVTSPSGVQAFPWTLDPASPGAPAVRTQADHVNNMEQVVVDNPEVGSWSVQVVGFNVPQGPQPFSVCVTPTFGGVVGVSVTLPDGAPDLLAPGVPTTINVNITTTNDTLVAGSPTLHYRYDGSVFLTSPMTPQGGDLYHATLPPAACTDTPEFYFSAEGAATGVVTNPFDAPVGTYSAGVGELVVVVSDDFETEM
ncbi:MAG: S8 family serine peptidase, partial [Phycisphaerae bacterium]